MKRGYHHGNLRQALVEEVISRHGDFPLQLHSRQVILLHWLTVLVLCPLGYFQPVFAVLAVLAYTWLLARLFFNRGAVDERLTAVQDEHLTGTPAGEST